MLTKADKQIVERDYALPGLVALLDSEVLLTQLQTIPQLKGALQTEIQYLRYKPSTSCAGTVKIKFEDGSVQYYFAKALTVERFERTGLHIKQDNDDIGIYAPFTLNALKIVFYHPAYDKGIPLDWLIDSDKRRQMFDKVSLPKLAKSELCIDILRYKPERRLVAKISDENKQPIAVIRCIKPSDFGKVLTGAVFGVAQGGVKLLGVDGSLCTLVTDWQDGESLCPEDGVLPSKADIENVAKVIADIHNTPYLHPTKYGHCDEIESLHAVLRTFKHILPDHAEWFHRLIQRIECGLASQPEIFKLIHGDFSLDQIVQNERGELYVLDWDRAVSANPLMDLATFYARLTLQVIEGVLPGWQADEIIHAFLYHYRQKTSCSFDGLRYFVATAILRLGAEPFRKRSVDWEQYTLQLLQQAEDVLSKTDDQFVVHSEKQIDLSADPILYTLTNHTEMQTLLMNALPPSEQGIVETVSLKRYKVGRRALIDYQVGTDNQTRKCIIGKYRSKGLDKRSYTIQQALWSKGFNDTAHVSVPEPLGILVEQHTWLQHKVNGRSLGEMLIPGNARLEFLGNQVANALNALHKSHVAQMLDLPVWTPLHELDILRDRLSQAQTLLPQWAARIASVLSHCEQLVNRLTEVPFVSVHRDFYQDQILERNGLPGQMVLLDLDLVCQGPAALDAGNYLAHIQEFALRNYADINALKVHEHAFLQRFLTESETSCLQDIEIYLTLSLARHIYISTLFQERLHTTEILLNVCEERLRKQLNK